MRFMEMTAPRLRALDRERPLVLLPIAAIEQHGPHAPTGTDTIICGAIAEAVEAARPQDVLLLPTQWLGASQHHLRFEATLTATLPTYISMLCEIVQPLLDNGFRRVMLLNGHGGNVDPLKVALRILQANHSDVLFCGHSYWSIAADEIAALCQGEAKAVGHACEIETSLIQHLRPGLIDDAAVENCGTPLPGMVEGLFVCRDMHQGTRNGATGRPDLATAETGEKLFAAIVERVGVAAGKMLSEPLPS